MNEVLSILALFDWTNSYKPDQFLITEKPLVIKWVNPFDKKKNIHHIHPVYGEKTRIIAEYYRDCFQEDCNIQYYQRQSYIGVSTPFGNFVQLLEIPYTKPRQ